MEVLRARWRAAATFNRRRDGQVVEEVKLDQSKIVSGRQQCEMGG